MNTRRHFLAHAPLGLIGVLAACEDHARDAAVASPAGPLRDVPADAPVLRWIPKHEDLVYTFGGAAPRQRIKPGTRIVTWTEDCFDGVVKTPADLPSKVMVPGHDNPQTGPFFVEGAEPGDTVAVHILKLEPARTYAVSAFSPGFGALVGTDQTAMLGAEFTETTWRYEVDSARNVARSLTECLAHTTVTPAAAARNASW